MSAGEQSNNAKFSLLESQKWPVSISEWRRFSFGVPCQAEKAVPLRSFHDKSHTDFSVRQTMNEHCWGCTFNNGKVKNLQYRVGVFVCLASESSLLILASVVCGIHHSNGISLTPSIQYIYL